MQRTQSVVHSADVILNILTPRPPGVDVRFFCDVPDISELPGAYKPAATVRAQIAEYGLADIVDTIQPLGSIMAGDWQTDAPWRKKQPKVAATSADESSVT